MKMTAKFILLVTTLLSLSACNKNDAVSDSNVWLPAGLKSYFLFYPGSYWITVLPGTDFVDSVFIESTRLDTQAILHPGSREPIGFSEKLTVVYFSPFYGRRYQIEAFGEPFCRQRGNNLPCFLIVKKNLKGNTDTVLQSSTIAYYPFEKDRILLAQARGTDILFATPVEGNYVQADSSYSNVWKITVNLDQTEQNQLSVRHFAPGIGQLRWQVPEFGFNWVVTRYRVKQSP